MARTLFTFLGRGTGKPGGGYRETLYALPGGPVRTSYIAFALIADRLARGEPFDRVVVLGTSGSMWDDLAVRFGGLAPDDPVVLSLKAAAFEGAFGGSDLAALERAIGRKAPLAVDCVLIPDCRRPEDIADVVGRIASRVVAADVVEFDVTHGFRHLPLLALSALNLVSALRAVTVAAVHYGAYEMKTNPQDPDEAAPVLDLKAYLSLMEWTRALAAFDASGDPTGIGRLIEAETGVTVAAEIATAAHRERMLDVDAVRQPWRKARLALGGSTGVGALFREALDARFAWTGAPSLAQRQRALSIQALNQGDPMRAALLLFEAAISAQLEANGARPEALTNHDDRKQAQFRLCRGAAFRELTALRNILAHPAARSSSEQALIAAPERMLATLRRLDAALFDPTGRLRVRG